MDAQFSLDTKIKVGIIGFGRMGRFYWEAMRKAGDGRLPIFAIQILQRANLLKISLQNLV